MAETILWLTLAYLSCGLVFAMAFATWGVGRVDHAARGTGLVFRIILVPGCTLLWPVLLIRWARMARQGDKT